ncbi:MAG: CDP-alcohol phosphatidyltransferase family protein [Syntrophaceae bacterium]|jgi:cardiolipin synthase (CMP-forming)|nr:CDP-alcohol phosphatidyltransferase family protein [Syntrophaceae bacterium]HQM44450.1 CDP-alcohol phosphatidyltransferase family protein [Smithellaceae bacterium]
MNIPNFLSLLRIILVPVFVIFLIQSEYDKALITFMVAGLTDALDGTFARVLNCQTTLGAYLDPIADKLLLVTSFVTLAIYGLIPGWLAVIVISRDCIILLGIAILTLMSIPYEIKPALVSKITTALQVATIFLALLYKTFTHDFSYIWIISLCWATAGFTVISGCVYIVRGVRILNNSASSEMKK